MVKSHRKRSKTKFTLQIFWPARQSLGMVWRRERDVLIRFGPSASPSGRRTNSLPCVREGSYPSIRLLRSQYTWRRERDSNPRSRYERNTRFPIVPLRPLGHLSVTWPPIINTSLIGTLSYRLSPRERDVLIRSTLYTPCGAPNRSGLGRGAWRRGWDLNPRLLSGEPLFESGALSHSATSPFIITKSIVRSHSSKGLLFPYNLVGA